MVLLRRDRPRPGRTHVALDPKPPDPPSTVPRPGTEGERPECGRHGWQCTSV